jgi:hypothetical protein
MAHFLIALVALAFTAGAAMAQQTPTYSKAVQQACASDYHEYGIDTEALRLCMDRAGARPIEDLR